MCSLWKLSGPIWILIETEIIILPTSGMDPEFVEPEAYRNGKLSLKRESKLRYRVVTNSIFITLYK